WLSRSIEATLRLGFRSAFEKKFPDGAIDATAWVVGIGIRGPVPSRARTFGLDAVARADALSLAFTGSPTSDATARAQSGLALVAAGGLAGRWNPGDRVRVGIEC